MNAIKFCLPTFITTLGIFNGILLIILTIKNYNELVIILITISLITDTLDGKIARKTATCSAFGKEIDSMSDIICFGFVPNLILYINCFYNIKTLGFLLFFVYMLNTIFRLGKFNIEQNKNCFVGLPTPISAIIILFVFWVGVDIEISKKFLANIISVLSVLLGILMISSIKLYNQRLRLKYPFVYFFVINICVMIFYDLYKLIFITLCTYIILSLYYKNIKKYI